MQYSKYALTLKLKKQEERRFEEGFCGVFSGRGEGLVGVREINSFSIPRIPCRRKRFTLADLVQMQLASGVDVAGNLVCSE